MKQTKPGQLWSFTAYPRCSTDLWRMEHVGAAPGVDTARGVSSPDEAAAAPPGRRASFWTRIRCASCRCVVLTVVVPRPTWTTSTFRQVASRVWALVNDCLDNGGAAAMPALTA